MLCYFFSHTNFMKYYIYLCVCVCEFTCPRTFKLIDSRAQTEAFRNNSFWSFLSKVMHLNYGSFCSCCWKHSLFVTCSRRAACGGKLMHPVGEPGSIDVSARLASTLAGFLSGASPSSWTFIFPVFWNFVTAHPFLSHSFICPHSQYWFSWLSHSIYMMSC